MTTDWATVGARVAVQYDGWGGSGVTIRTVERLTATQIVLDNGSRYRRDTGRVVGDGRSSLAPLDDPKVRSELTAQRIRALRYKLDQLLGQHKPGNDPGPLLNNAEALIRATRDAFTGKAGA